MVGSSIRLEVDDHVNSTVLGVEQDVTELVGNPDPCEGVTLARSWREDDRRGVRGLDRYCGRTDGSKPGDDDGDPQRRLGECREVRQGTRLLSDRAPDFTRELVAVECGGGRTVCSRGLRRELAPRKETFIDPKHTWASAFLVRACSSAASMMGASESAKSWSGLCRRNTLGRTSRTASPR
jgi:hypothetical protein